MAMENIDTIRDQLRSWTIAGPMHIQQSMDPWLPTELDAATKIPVSFKFEGHDVPVCKVVISANDLDLREHLKPGPGIPQAVVFCEFEVPEDLTLTLTYDADWSNG